MVDEEILTPDNLQTLAKFILEYTGIVLERVAQKTLLTKLSKHIAKTGAQCFTEYFYLLTSPSNSAIRDELISLITVSESYFFRNPDQFRYIAKDFFPKQIENKSKNNDSKTMKIVSAGCSTGEEAYSLAAIALWFKKSCQECDMVIHAFDINCENIKYAKKGIYRERSIRPCSKSFMKEFNLNLFYEDLFNKNKEYNLREEIKQIVDFKVLNLKNFESLKIYAGSDIIMCRNVLIYFEDNFRREIINALCKLLNYGGMLFLGETESLPEPPKDLTLVHCYKAYGYQKVKLI